MLKTKDAFERVENRVIEVEIDEEILGLETQLEANKMNH